MTATCKITDPPPQQAELSVAPPANCAQQIQAPTDQSQTDSDVLHDEIIGDLMERATGVPMSPQKVGTEAASAALDAVANRMNSEILAKAAEFIASDTFGLPLSITLSGSEAGSPQLDQMTLDQYRAYQQQQYEQLQSNFFLQNPQTFCAINTFDSRCGFLQSQSQAPRSANAASGSTPAGRPTATAPPPKKPTGPPCGGPVCTAP